MASEANSFSFCPKNDHIMANCWIVFLEIHWYWQIENLANVNSGLIWRSVHAKCLKFNWLKTYSFKSIVWQLEFKNNWQVTEKKIKNVCMPVWTKMGIKPTSLYTRPVQQEYRPPPKNKKIKIFCLSERSLK